MIPIKPLYGRCALAGLTAFVAVGLATELPDRTALAVSGAAVAVVAGAALFLFRSRHPGALAVASSAGIVLLANGRPGSLAWFAICVLGGCVVLGVGTSAGVAYWVAAVLLFGSEWLTVHDPGWGAWTAGISLTALATIAIRRQLTLVEQLRALQADLAERSRAEERNRIARDLHDVIAHSLTVSLLHVSSARLAVEFDPAEASQALSDAERLTRQSLDDVRVTVGMLRQADDNGIAPPTPGVGDLSRLVDDLRAAHADVSLSIDGEVDGLPATTGATIYQVVRESLTNAARHAPGSPVVVKVVAQRDRVDVSIDSAGPPGHGSGMGMLNMKERAEAVGGRLDAGPGGSGWLVHASLPRRASQGERA